MPTFDTIIMPFGDELAACCGFTTAFAIKTAFPCCWEVLTRLLEPNSKAAYRCYKGRLEKKFSYFVLFRWTLLLPRFHISVELQPWCLVTPYAFYPQLNVPTLQFRKKQNWKSWWKISKKLTFDCISRICINAENKIWFLYLSFLTEMSPQRVKLA